MKCNAYRKDLAFHKEVEAYDTGYETSQHDIFVPMLLCMIASGIGGGIIALVAV